MSQKLLCESYLSQSKWDLVAAALEATRSADKAIRVFFPQPPSLGGAQGEGCTASGAAAAVPLHGREQ